MRWNDATEKVWRKLKEQNLADYNKEKDFYFTT